MGAGVKVRLGLITCGTCGRQRGMRHTCITRADSKRRKTRTKVKPRVTVVCGKCGKARGLRHTCLIKTDFKKRLKRQARQERTAANRRRKAEGEARRKAAAAGRKAEARTKPKRPRERHDPETCRLPDCDRYGCKKYREGFVDGHEDGFDEGYDEGVLNCPRPHGAA
jgi:hypothetical protein